MSSDTIRPILLVDDFDDGRELYAEYLSFKGYPVRTAASGAEAIQAIQAEHPSLILMDIGMREMTGTAALKWLRENHVCDEVPIVALTAFALEEEVTQALADGFDAVIPKPCLPDDLLTFVTSILSKAART